MTGSLSGLSDRLIISIGTGSATVTHALTISANLQDVADAINRDTAVGGLNNTANKVVASVVNGALKLTNGTATTAGANNTISIVDNNASEAVGLATAGQIVNTTATGVAATKLDMTVSTLKTTEASTAAIVHGRCQHRYCSHRGVSDRHQHGQHGHGACQSHRPHHSGRHHGRNRQLRCMPWTAPMPRWQRRRYCRRRWSHPHDPQQDPGNIGKSGDSQMRRASTLGLAQA